MVVVPATGAWLVREMGTDTVVEAAEKKLAAVTVNASVVIAPVRAAAVGV